MKKPKSDSDLIITQSAFFAENREKILAFGEYFLEKLSDTDVLYYKGYLKYTSHYNTRNRAVCDTFSEYCVAEISAERL